jgi:hypothetical protein
MSEYARLVLVDVNNIRIESHLLYFISSYIISTLYIQFSTSRSTPDNDLAYIA